MSKLPGIVLTAALFMAGCTPTSIGGGGASETVATVAPSENGSGLAVSITGPEKLLVTAFVCHEKFSCIDTGHFNVKTELSDAEPELVVPALPESTLHIFVVDSTRGIAAFFLYDNGSHTVRQPQSKKLVDCGSVAGRVLLLMKNGDSTAVAACRVAIEGSFYSSVTDASGGYLMTGIPEGSYTIQAEGPNIRTKENNAAPDITITGKTTQQQDIHFLSTN